MDSTGSITRLIHDLHSNEPAARALAARLVWERYFRELLLLARNHLDPRIRRRVGAEDVLQSMYCSFCRRQQRGDFDLASRDDLRKLLVTITLRKARNAAHHHRQAKRDVGREQDTPAVLSDSDAPAWALEQMDASEPTPAEAALLNEALERRLQRLDDPSCTTAPTLRQIALGKLEGYTNQDLAAQYGFTVRTIERKLERIRAKWETSTDVC